MDLKVGLQAHEVLLSRLLEGILFTAAALRGLCNVPLSGLLEGIPCTAALVGLCNGMLHPLLSCRLEANPFKAALRSLCSGMLRLPNRGLIMRVVAEVAARTLWTACC